MEELQDHIFIAVIAQVYCLYMLNLQTVFGREPDLLLDQLFCLFLVGTDGSQSFSVLLQIIIYFCIFLFIIYLLV